MPLFVIQDFFQYYMESNGSALSTEEENRMDLLKKGRLYPRVYTIGRYHRQIPVRFRINTARFQGCLRAADVLVKMILV